MKKITTLRNILSIAILIGSLSAHQVYAATPPTNNDDNCATELKDDLRLNCFPNPFRNETTISYIVPNDTKVSIKIYNAIAQEVRTLVAEVQPEGSYQILWDGEANSGYKAPPGTYFLRVQIGNQYATKQLLMLK
jgi:hypothetical protein